jgi:hypothetical protein
MVAEPWELRDGAFDGASRASFSTDILGEILGPGSMSMATLEAKGMFVQGSGWLEMARWERSGMGVPWREGGEAILEDDETALGFLGEVGDKEG